MIDAPTDAKAERTRDSGILFSSHPLLAPSCDVLGGGARVLGLWDENHAGEENTLLGTGSPTLEPAGRGAEVYRREARKEDETERRLWAPPIVFGSIVCRVPRWGLRIASLNVVCRLL